MAAPKYSDIGAMLNTDLLGQWKMMSPEDRAKSWYSFTGRDPSQTQTGGGEGGGSISNDPGEAWKFSYDKAKMPPQWRGLDPMFDPASNTMHYNQDFLNSLPGTKFTKNGKAMSGGWDQSKTMYPTLQTLGADQSGPDLSFFTGQPGHGGIKNKSMMYYDPNYGWITPQENTYNVAPKQDAMMAGIEKLAKPAMMAAVTMMGAPELAMAMNAFNATTGMISGNTNILSGILSMLGGASGIPGGGALGGMIGSLGQGGGARGAAPSGLAALFQMLSKAGLGSGGGRG